MGLEEKGASYDLFLFLFINRNKDTIPREIKKGIE